MVQVGITLGGIGQTKAFIPVWDVIRALPEIISLIICEKTDLKKVK
jgi:hypothetical protein